MPYYNVLVVDNSELFRTEITKYVNCLQGFKVIEQAKDGNEAIKLTQQFEPDIVLMDIRMPGMNGVEAAREIKSHFPKIKIVFVTIHDEEIYPALASILPVDGFVNKSSLKNRLLEVLKNLFP